MAPLLVTLLYGLGGDLFAASRGAMLKAMVDDELLAEANGAYQSIREGLRIVAPLAGAGIFAASGGSVVALVDAGTFLVSAAALVALRFAEPARAVKEHHFVKEISAGLTHIARTRVLRELTIGLATALLVAGFSETLIFAVTSDALHRSPSFVGVLGTARASARSPAASLRRGSCAASATCALPGSASRSSGSATSSGWCRACPSCSPSTAVAGVGIVWAVVSLSTAYQRRSPNEVQGRVAAAANMLFSVPQTIGIAVGAALITARRLQGRNRDDDRRLPRLRRLPAHAPPEETTAEVEPALAA